MASAASLDFPDVPVLGWSSVQHWDLTLGLQNETRKHTQQGSLLSRTASQRLVCMQEAGQTERRLLSRENATLTSHLCRLRALLHCLKRCQFCLLSFTISSLFVYSIRSLELYAKIMINDCQTVLGSTHCWDVMFHLFIWSNSMAFTIYTGYRSTYCIIFTGIKGIHALTWCTLLKYSSMNTSDWLA